MKFIYELNVNIEGTVPQVGDEIMEWANPFFRLTIGRFKAANRTEAHSSM
jgi:hypothetical protein